MAKLSKNSKGEYNYFFNWQDENGSPTGWNDVWAPNMRLARKEARKMETKAHWSLWDADSHNYITVPKKVIGKGHCFRMSGMYIIPESFKKQTFEYSCKMDRIATMITC
jgi:hypothetical protein